MPALKHGGGGGGAGGAGKGKGGSKGKGAAAAAAAAGGGGGAHIRIDGSTPALERARLVDRFQRDPTVRVALLSITASDTCCFDTHACPADDAMLTVGSR